MMMMIIIIIILVPRYFAFYKIFYINNNDLAEAVRTQGRKMQDIFQKLDELNHQEIRKK